MVLQSLLKARGELLTPTNVVNLIAQFYDANGNPANTDTFPRISIVMPSGLVSFSPTSAGVSQLNVGQYLFQFTVPFNGPYGVWQDIWMGSVSGTVTVQTLSFIVSSTQLPAIINSDGYVSLGDDPGFNYSQTASRNINKLVKALRARLNSSGKSRSTDGYGNVIYVDCDIFSADMLTTFIAQSLSSFNEIPFFTFYTFDDTPAIDQFFNNIVEGATLTALASQALIERGREFTVTDNGVNFTPPSISEVLLTEYNSLLTNYYERLKYIKNSIRSAPLGLGIFDAMQGANPLVKRLRMLRERQIF